MTNPKAAEFLKAIELGQSSDEEEEVQSDDWNQLYLALQCLEHMFAVEPKKLNGLILAADGLLDDVRFVGWKHTNYWVRLATQRLFGNLFSSIGGKPLSSLFSQDSLLKLAYEMLDGFKCQYVAEELARQLVKNLVFVSRQMTADHEDLAKIYAKTAFVGRKLLGTKHETSQTKLRALIQFFSAMIALSIDDKQLLEASVSPMLKLVYRTYSDE